MDSAMPVTPLPHEPTTIHDDSLTPLLLGLGGGVDDLDDFDFGDIFDPNERLDLCDLLSLAVDDPEPTPAGQQQQQQPPPPPPPQQQQQQSHDAGNDGDVSSVMSEVDFSPYAGCAGRGVRSLAEVGEMTSWSNNDTASCCGGTGGGKKSTPNLNDTPRTTTGWSTTSASEDSDDSSPMSISSSRPTHGGASPGYPPAMGETGRQSSGDADHHPAAAAAVSAPSNNKRAATATSAAAAVKPSAGGTPILPLTYAPAFDGTGYASSSSTMPAAAFAAAASGAVGQLTAYWKRQCDRGGDLEGDGGGGINSALLAQRSARLLSARGDGGGGGEGGGVVGRVTKKAKKEERLMKNREAANRSRAKRKETMTNLETHVQALSTRLAESQAQCAAVQKENASLREQNSFLRGVISEKEKVAIDMPPVVPTRTTRSGSRAVAAGSSSGSSSGGGVTLSGLTASVACAASAAIGCVALSAARFEGSGVDGAAPPNGGRGVGVGAGVGRGGAGRTLLSVDDYEYTNPEGRSALAFGGAIQYLLDHEGLRLLAGVGLTLAFLVVLVFVVAPWGYETAMRHSAGKRGTRGSRSRGVGLDLTTREEPSGVFRGLRWLSSDGGGGRMLKRR